MKKLLFLLWMVILPVIGIGQVINLETITKLSFLELTDSLILPGLATSETKVLSPTATGRTISLETVDATTITYDTLTANVFESNGTYNGFQSNGTTSLYYHEHNAPAFSTSTGASGATLTAPSANTLGGYQLNANTEKLYHSMHIESDWDGKTDIIIEVFWEVNEASSADGTVDLQLICYYKGDHEATNKTQTLEVAHTITGNKAQFTQHMTLFTIDWDLVDNVVQAEDILGFILNLETDTSECDDIIINHIVSKYPTTKPAPETN